MLDVIAPRSAEDILSRVVRVTLGGQTYELPVRSIRANREWKANLEARLAMLVDRLTSADEADDARAALNDALASQVDDLIELLIAYDTAGVLPSREQIEEIEPDATMAIVMAVREVWRAANPLVATAIGRMAETPTEPSSPPTSSPPVSITGPRKRSRTA
jgi:hypothetical protein